MPYRLFGRTVCCVLLAAGGLVAQQAPSTPEVTNPPTPAQLPEANPGRPTVATPATLTPVGYLQFETGAEAAWHSSAGVVSQTSISEVIKYAVSSRIELLAAAQPYVHSHDPANPTNGTGDVALGIQGVVHKGEGANPTVALAYFGRVYAGDSPDLDIGSFSNGALVLASADVKGFHYDANLFFNEVVDDNVRRAQFGEALSISHALWGKFGMSGEIWHFTQPFLHGNAVGNLWAVDYVAKKTLVLDCGFDHGLTSTSTQWEVFAGFTYLLPHKLPLHW
jgi:hypothetical protein